MSRGASMAVGRISGPLLSKNLLRDGVDLAFETDLLYLDVTTGRIGINTSTFLEVNQEFQRPLSDLNVRLFLQVLPLHKTYRTRLQQHVRV